MSKAELRVPLAIVAVICVSWPAAARAGTGTQEEYLSVLANMVAQQAPRSVHDAARIRDEYQPYIAPLALDDFAQIEEGLATGGLVPLPLHPERFNIRVRLEGSNPIGEMDRLHQASYVAARPGTIGCLLDVASRVKSGPLEVTSLVRHLEYQNQLRLTNPNATTDVPTHALGLAFDIAVVNRPLQTVREIRDVLQRMSDAGDILVILERQQLVFHVVPQPSRLGWYSQVYADAIAGHAWSRAVDQRDLVHPFVTTAIGALRPLPEWAAEWWAADNVPVDLPVAPRVSEDDGVASRSSGRIFRYIAFVGEFLSLTWEKTRPWTIG